VGSQNKEGSKELPFNYPWYSTRVLANIIRLGYSVSDAAKKSPPAAKKVWMIINNHDEAVNNEMCQMLVDKWLAAGAKNVDSYHSPMSWRYLMTASASSSRREKQR